MRDILRLGVHTSPRLSAQDVIQAVSRQSCVSLEALLGEQRGRVVAWPRMLAMYVMRLHCPHLSYPMMGRALGGRDHTTVIYGCRRWPEIEEAHPVMARLREDVEADLGLARQEAAE